MIFKINKAAIFCKRYVKLEAKLKTLTIGESQYNTRKSRANKVFKEANTLKNKLFKK